MVDDFAPGGSTTDVARFHKEADRFLRAQGNNAGRGRCRTDGTVRAGRPPRGTTLSTGEDVPRGPSLRPRLMVLESARDELDWGALTECQRDAAAGLFAQAMSGFVSWLAPRYGEVRDGLRAQAAALREKARGEGQHARQQRARAYFYQTAFVRRQSYRARHVNGTGPARGPVREVAAMRDCRYVTQSIVKAMMLLPRL